MRLEEGFGGTGEGRGGEAAPKSVLGTCTSDGHFHCIKLRNHVIKETVDMPNSKRAVCIRHTGSNLLHWKRHHLISFECITPTVMSLDT
jgi:hypothetical protein